MRKLVCLTLLIVASLATSHAMARPMLKFAAAPGKCPADAVCGVLMRPLDPSGKVKGRIPIVYRLYLHTDHNAALAGTIVAQEGGPGYPTIASRYSYLRLFAPLRKDHDILMVNARGTGGSAIHCAGLQTNVVTPRDVGECGRSLGRASTLYGTRLAADDMAAVLDKLHIGKVDYYGDSYGTFFGQVFTALYPDRLRSVVLDGAYPVIGETPWYSHAAHVVRTGFQLACARSPYCAGLKGNTLDRIRGLVRETRRNPFSGRAADAEGKMRDVTVDPSSIGLLLFNGGQGPVNYRDLDAAIRALHGDGDRQPLLRLIAENNANEDSSPERFFSYGLFAAVSCMDYQQIYSMLAKPKERHAQRDAALERKREKRPDVYDPLSLRDFATVPIDISVLNLCIDWPVKDPPYHPGKPIPDDAKFTQAPTLVMNGELDMLTTAAEGAIVTAQYPHGQHVVVANSFHVDAIYDIDDCAQNIVRHFVLTLEAGDTSCAARVKEVRLVPYFMRHANDAIPAVPAYGNRANQHERAIASAAVQTAGDVFVRWNINYSGNGVGLRGGRWRYTDHGHQTHYSLTDVLWTEDLPVSGTLDWNQDTGAISADLHFAVKDGTRGDVTAAWNDRDRRAVAQLSGQIGDHMLAATMPAP